MLGIFQAYLYFKMKIIIIILRSKILAALHVHRTVRDRIQYKYRLPQSRHYTIFASHSDKADTPIWRTLSNATFLLLLIKKE